MKVSDVMTRSPVTCNCDMPVTEVAHLMKQYNCGEIPVTDDGPHHKLIGVITDRDITCRVVAGGRNPRDVSAREIMSTPVRKVSATDDLETALQVMERTKLRRLPVIDSEGRCVGVLSQVDIARISISMAAEVMRETSRAPRT